ncbi:MAG: class I SAM-dependent methyltransferase [Betaproteobacteria bacterium]|nr:class I SAM-dependent methyltransferase [Betaproteobacteria bacterium]
MEKLKALFYSLPVGLQKALRPLIKGVRYLTGLRIVSGPIAYGHNKLYTAHNADFLKDKSFMHAYEEAAVQTGFTHPAPWRVLVNCWAIRRAVQECKGDLVECGTWLGTTALTGMIYSGFLSNNHSKRFFLVDSWEGIDESNLFAGESIHYVKDKNDKYSGIFPEIERKFKDKHGVVLVKGFVPEILQQIDSELISYLHIDMNAAHPEVEALKYFWPKLSQGAVVVLDDYGFKGRHAQKNAIDALCIQLGTTVLPLPTGQGLILKP